MSGKTRELYSNLEFRRMLDKISQEGEAWGILVIGFDGFKRINNLYSYSFGDKVLESFAAKVGALLPPEATLYKLDGDSFGVLQKDTTEDEIRGYFEGFQHIAKNGIYLENANISLALSGGVCFAPVDGQDGESLHKNVRIALIDSKEQGGNRLTILSSALLEKVQFSMNLLESIKESVQNDFEGFSLHYQPLILTQTGELYGCEVLLRWRHKAFPIGVSPYQFVPILENYGMMVDVGNWVLEHAVMQLKEWIKIMPNFQMSINVSTIQFENPYFKRFVLDTLLKHKIPANLITLELTESGQISNVKYVGEIFNFLRSQGIKIAFDDFGTGYASLEIFRVLSADELKIDRSFLNRISYDVTDQKIVAQLIQLCDSMNMFVCVEGIETKEIETIAKQLNPKLLQGYYYSKPLCAGDFFDLYFGENTSVSMQSTCEDDVSEKNMIYAPSRPAKPMTMDEILDNAYAGIFQVSMDQKFTFLTCNEGYRRMLGYTTTEIDQKFGNQALGFIHPDDADYFNEEIRRQLGQGDIFNAEFRVVRSDGSPLWIMATGNVVKGKNGSDSLVVVTLENDAKKKESLRKTEENSFNTAILSRIPTGIKYLRFDKDFTIEYFSDGFLAILGYARHEIETLFDNKYINLIYEEDREKVVSDVLEQLKISNVVVLHYRSYRKDGSLIWVQTISCLYPADEDGIQRFCSSVVNVTDTITEEKKERTISLAARYQQAAALWGDIIFEYNFQTQKFTCSDNFKKIFDKEPFEDLTSAADMIHRDDKVLLENAMAKACAGEASTCVELRMRQGDGKYVWCSLSCNQPDKIGGVSMSVIGKIYKIDEGIQKQQDLIKKLEVDALTGLLNKSAMESGAMQRMSNSDNRRPFALFTLDIDNFQAINHEYGHMIGDEMLQILAKRLQSVFKAQDLIARTGGDKFMVFTEFSEDYTSLENKCGKVLRTFHEPIKLGDKLLRVSVSLGVAYTKNKYMEFFDLYQQSNQALYRAKELGKGTYSIL